MAVTTPTQLPPGVQESLDMTILSTPTAQYIFKVGALKKYMPSKGGNTSRQERYNALQSFKIPLGSSAITPASQQLSTEFIDIEIQKYGTYVELAEELLLHNQDAVLHNAALRLGQALRQTEDELLSEMIASAATRIQAVSGSNGDVPSEVTADDNDEITTALLNANGHMFMDAIEGDDKYATAPVQPSYLAMTNTVISPDLRKMDDFVDIANYPVYQKRLNGEWGTCHNARFLISTIAPFEENSSANGNTVYDIIYSAKEGYISMDQRGGEARFIYHGPELSGPLEQSVTAASKFFWGGAIANDQWVAILEVTKL